MFPKPYQLYSVGQYRAPRDVFFDGQAWWLYKTMTPFEGDIHQHMSHIDEKWTVSFTNLYGVPISVGVRVVVDLPVCREHEPERWKKKKFARMSDEQWACVRAHFEFFWNGDRYAPHVRYSDEAWLKHMVACLSGPNHSAVPIMVAVQQLGHPDPAAGECLLSECQQGLYIHMDAS